MSHADYVEAVRACVEADLGIRVLAHATAAHWFLQTAWHSINVPRLHSGSDPRESAEPIARLFKLAMASDANRLDDWETYDRERHRSIKEQR